MERTPERESENLSCSLGTVSCEAWGHLAVRSLRRTERSHSSRVQVFTDAVWNASSPAQVSDSGRRETSALLNF